ncbi:MAG TPA: HlyD family type I secretion periplasmic adaptor subunit [Allosphingosinicella sp.]|jgi:HlyD family type I secretion membrane fusion protein|nr:HlyD family type I secretion periplasmic adaptor subunit [Allosphingosinicella sp.]
MKLDFSSFGAGGAGGGGTARRRFIPRALLKRYMRDRLDVRPLDDAHRTVRVGLIAAGLFFGIFLLFALLAPMSGAAVAQGEVTVSGSKLVIQPVSTGIVSDILVREGQAVAAGQPLVRLNGVRSGAQLRQAQARRDSLRAAEARLIAERDGLDRLLFPPDLASRSGDPTAAAAMRAQLALFERHGSILGADRALTETQLAAALARHAASERQLQLIQDELEGMRILLAKGFARKTTIRALERSEAQLRADTLTGAAAIEEAQIGQRKTRDGQMMQLVGELNQVQEQLAQVNPQLDMSRYYADQDLMRAPVAGRVSGVAQLGPGSVVNGGRTLMELVPNGRALIVQAKVKPSDIDDVHLGAVATVRFTSVNPRGRSSFKGRVVTLSPARVGAESGGEGYYLAQIALDDPAGAAADGVVLQPGLPATINIETASRTLWDYLVAPLTDAMSGGMREE